MRIIRYLAVSLLVIPALLVVALGPRAGDDLPAGRVVVDYWEKWTGVEEQQMRQIVDEFNATVGAKKNIFVRYLSTSSIDRKTLVATAAGVPPDIAGLWDGNVVQYAAQDSLEPLDDLAREFGIDSSIYKPVYWRACNYNGHLYSLISTPAAVCLTYNRLAFEENADALRAAGLDPNRPPRTIAELDRYALALDKKGPGGRIDRAGYLPMEPGWYLPYTCWWFGGDVIDPARGKLTLTDPGVVASYEWIGSYARRLGKSAMADFRSGFGNFDSPQNAFVTGTVLMVQQGPWMAAYLDHLVPEKQRLLFSRAEEMNRPVAERRKNYYWAAAAFPSVSEELKNVTFAGFDALVIPRGARHKREAFEFMAWVNRQDIMEKLCMMHCKNSPLAKVSENFVKHHPNPYIEVFEELASSPNAHGVPQIPIWQEVVDELNDVAQQLTLVQTDAATALAGAQQRMQARYDKYLEKQRSRKALAAGGQ